MSMERVLPGGHKPIKTSCSAATAAWKEGEEESRRLLEFQQAPGHPVLPVPADEEAWRAAPRRACNWLRLLFESSPFHQPDPGQVLDPTHDLRLKDMLRTKQARSEIRSMNQQTMLQCLERGMSTSLLLVR